MVPISLQQRAVLEKTSHILRVRERGLLQLTQSPRCTNRAGAEAELARVRAEIEATFAQLREEFPCGFACPRLPRL